MNFLQQMALSQAGFAMGQIVRWYGKKYFGKNELEAIDTVLNALSELPQRIHPDLSSTAVVTSTAAK